MSSIPEDISRIKPDTTSDLEDIEEEDEGQGHHDHKNSAADAATSSGRNKYFFCKKAKYIKFGHTSGAGCLVAELLG